MLRVHNFWEGWVTVALKHFFLQLHFDDEAIDHSCSQGPMIEHRAPPYFLLANDFDPALA